MENQLNTNQNLVPLSWIGQDQISTQSAETITQSVEANSENGRERVLRDAGGKLLPGGPGLPGSGRPKGSGLVSDAIKQALREGKADEVKATLFNLMEAADKDSVRLAAVAEIIDRSEGKATQNIRHAGVFMVMAPGAEALAALDGWADDE